MLKVHKSRLKQPSMIRLVSCEGPFQLDNDKIINENDVLFSNDTGKLGKKIRVLLSGVEPKTFDY